MKKALENILVAGVSIWAEQGERFVTSRNIAKMIGRTHAAVVYYFHTAEDMREAIAKHAVETKNATVICKLIASNHSAVADMATPVRMKWLDSLRKPSKSG